MVNKSYIEKARELYAKLPVFRGASTLAVLLALKEHPYLNANQLGRLIHGETSTPIYKAVKILRKHGLIGMIDHRRLVLTKRGAKALLSFQEIIDTRPEIPEVKLKFKV